MLSGWILCFDKKMGNCVLVHKSSDPAMQFGLQVETPTKERLVPAVAEPGFYGQLSSEGQEQEDSSPSKPEMFFDSQAWLDSDCEDYFSINSDFTPSRGNTPIHPKSFVESTLQDKTITSTDHESDAIPKPPPADANKQLFELFCESFRHDTTKERELEDVSKDINFPHHITTIKSPYRPMPGSVCSSVPTPNRGGYLNSEDKSSQSAQCCFPGLVRSLSFRERKKRPLPAKSGAW